MKTLLTSLLTGLLAATLLGGCAGQPDALPTPPGGGYLDFCLNGKTYHAVARASAVEYADTSLLLSASSDDGHTVVTIRLAQLARQGSVHPFFDARHLPLSAATVAVLTLGGQQYSTQNGPATANGSVTVTRYDRARQLVAGTFSCVAGAEAAGTPAVSNGRFCFTRFY